MNLEELEKIDSRKMFKVYDEWDKIARKYYEHEFVKPIEPMKGVKVRL